MYNAIVIKFGDPKYAEALAAGVRGGLRQRCGAELAPHEMAVLKTEWQRLKTVEAQHGVSAPRDRELWAAKIAVARRNYRQPRWFPRLRRAFRAVQGVYALGWLIARDCYRKLQAINREGAADRGETI